MVLMMLATIAAGISLLFAPLHAATEPSIYGFNLPAWQKEAYGSEDAARSLSLMAETGGKWVALTPTWYMASRDASVIEPSNTSASDESLRKIIEHAKSLGLHIVLKPHVDLPPNDRRTNIHSKDPAAWFDCYRKMLTHYAVLAQEEQIELLVIGTELHGMVGHEHRAQWEKTIKAIRSAYSGKLTYAANFFGVRKICFWDLLDFIGINGYYPIVGGTHELVLRKAWNVYLPSVRHVAHAYGKPVLFTEIGLSSQKGANYRPWDYGNFGRVDLKVQKAYFQSFIDTFRKKSYFAGFLQWAWELDPNAGGPNDKTMTVQGKPALDVLKNYFASLQSPKKSPIGGTIEKTAVNASAIAQEQEFLK